MKLLLPACIADLDALLVLRGGEALPLTPLEASLLRYLAERADRVVPRGELLEAVWGYRPGVKSRAVDNTVARLRTKIEEDSAEPTTLTSAHGAGYRLILRTSLAGPLRGNLPPLPRLIGRDVLVAEVLEALAPPGARITLHGPGGVGKTALAIAVAHHAHLAAERWWVDCSSARQAREVAIAVAAVLGVPLEARDPWEHVALALEGRNVLLVLDDLDGCATELEEPLSSWRPARILCTSRVLVGGERAWVVPPLDPASGAALFSDLAGAEVVLSESDRAELVSRLDGLPLHIALVAARATVMSPASLLRQAGRALDPDEELSASYLGPERHAALVRLSVLPGPFSAETALAVGVGPDRLHDLLRRSLVSRVDAARPRFRLLQTLRAYFCPSVGPPPPWAAAQQAARAALTAEHLAQGPAWRDALDGPGEPEARAWFADEHLAIRACVHATTDARTRADLTVLLDPVLATRGPWSERLALLERARAEAPGHRRVASCLAEALGDAGRTHEAIALGQALLQECRDRDGWVNRVALVLHRQLCSVGDWEAARGVRDAHADGSASWMAEEARWWRGQGQVAAAEQAYRRVLPALHVAGRERELAEARVGLAQVLGGPDLPEARALLVMAADAMAAREDRRGEVEARMALGLIQLRLADWPAAREALTAADVLHRELGRPASGMARSHLGLVALAQGDLAAADRLFSEAVALHRAADRAASGAVALANLGALRAEQGRLADAAALLERALEALQGRGSRRVIGNFQAQLAIVRSRRGDVAGAEAARGAARALLERAPDPYGEAVLTIAEAWAALPERPAEVRATLAALEAGDPRWDPMVGFFVGRLCAPLRAAGGR